MKTLYLHIGTPKTGTTSLQHFCTENAEILQQKGYMYPLFPHKFKKTNIMRNAFFLSYKAYHQDGSRNMIEEESIYRQGMDFVLNTFRNTDNIILSDEAIWNVVCKRGKADLWEKLKKEADKNNFVIKIIVYLRRQDSLAESWWNQKIKFGERVYSKTSWENFLQDPSKLELNYAEPLKKIEQIFGKENLIVRRFGRQYFKNGSLYEDYMDALGVKYSSHFKISEGKHNVALNGNTPEIKRVINTLPDLSHENNVFFRRIAVAMSEQESDLKAKSMFSTEEARSFMERYRDGNRKVMQEYFGQDEDLFAMDFSYDKWEMDHTKMEQDIIRFFGHAVVKLREENKEMQTKVSALEKELEEQKKVMTDLQRRLENPLRKMWASFKGKK